MEYSAKTSMTLMSLYWCIKTFLTIVVLLDVCSSKQLVPFVAQYKALQKDNKKWKRGLITLATFLILIFLRTVTTSILATQANRVADVNTGDIGCTSSTQTLSLSWCIRAFLTFGVLTTMCRDFLYPTTARSQVFASTRTQMMTPLRG
uniref:Uncharacterized protein n=1 Tax=Helicotheca tamesis TaxID=374047 RepID=A0A7S2IHM1_9STRA|mmetsp:Transcript_9442/g.13149  ORF Transcript_9442/g.13149 Transcript_9442/m.13149 type:complete len:148 (+) Transcript_9442:112-555(+)